MHYFSMKIPETPPTIEDDSSKGNASRFMDIIKENVGLTDKKGRYLHWEKLKYLQPPDNLNPEEYWIATKLARNGALKPLPLMDKSHKLFAFCTPNILHKELHWLDQNAAGSLSMDKPITNPHTRDTYLRTARAIFYWAMARHGYWLLEFVYISKIIKQAPAKYGLAYLHTETDDNDLTYFLIHQIEVIKKGIASLHEYLERKSHEFEETEVLLDNSKAKGMLNHRQLSLLKHALKNPNAMYRIQEHQASHAISYQTARMDLLNMSDKLNLLRKRKQGTGFVFVSPSDLKSRLINNQL